MCCTKRKFDMAVPANHSRFAGIFSFLEIFLQIMAGIAFFHLRHFFGGTSGHHAAAAVAAAASAPAALTWHCPTCALREGCPKTKKSLMTL